MTGTDEDKGINCCHDDQEEAAAEDNNKDGRRQGLLLSRGHDYDYEKEEGVRG